MIAATFTAYGMFGTYKIHAEDIDVATQKMARELRAHSGNAKLEWSRREGDEQVTSYNVHLVDANGGLVCECTAVVRIPKSDKIKNIVRRDLRKKAGFTTQESLADHAGLTKRTVFSWESGQDGSSSVLLDLYLHTLIRLQAFELLVAANLRPEGES